MMAGSWLCVTHSPQERGELPDGGRARGWPGVGAETRQSRMEATASWVPGWRAGVHLKGHKGTQSQAATRRGPAVHGMGFRAAAGCWGWRLLGHPAHLEPLLRFVSSSDSEPWSLPPPTVGHLLRTARPAGISCLWDQCSQTSLVRKSAARGQLHTRAEIEPDN